MSKFSEYLVETGFYFANISNPNKTLYGNTVVQPTTKGNRKKKKADDSECVKSDTCDDVKKNIKLSTYFQLVNAIQ